MLPPASISRSTLLIKGKKQEVPGDIDFSLSLPVAEKERRFFILTYPLGPFTPARLLTERGVILRVPFR